MGNLETTKTVLQTIVLALTSVNLTLLIYMNSAKISGETKTFMMGTLIGLFVILVVSAIALLILNKDKVKKFLNKEI